MRLLEQIPKTADEWRIVAGLCMLWFALMVSPYYPFWLSTSFSQSGVDTISLWHSLYSLALIVAFLLIIVLQKRETNRLAKNVPVVSATGATVSALLLIFVPFEGPVGIGLAALTTIFCAAYVAVYLIICAHLLVQTQKHQPAFTLCVSFVCFCVLWGVLLIAGSFALRVATALSPIVGFLCLMSQIRYVKKVSVSVSAATSATAITSVSDEVTALKTLPWGTIGICIVLIYFAALAVRAFTAMGTGVPGVGGLGLLPQLVTVAGALVMVTIFGLVFAKRDATTVNVMLLVTALALIYMGALLIITLADPSGWLVLGAKRILVAAQHSTEVLLFAILAEEVSRRNLSPRFVFSLAGVIACAGPQFVSLDILHVTGAMQGIAQSPHIALIASVGAFLIAALAMAMLANYARRLVSDIEVKGDVWGRELCKRATAAYAISPRELDVVIFTYRGYSAPKIAKELMVSESTVKAHLAHSYKKLNVHSKQELIALIDSYQKQ